MKCHYQDPIQTIDLWAKQVSLSEAISFWGGVYYVAVDTRPASFLLDLQSSFGKETTLNNVCVYGGKNLQQSKICI